MVVLVKKTKFCPYFLHFLSGVDKVRYRRWPQKLLDHFEFRESRRSESHTFWSKQICIRSHYILSDWTLFFRTYLQMKLFRTSEFVNFWKIGAWKAVFVLCVWMKLHSRLYHGALRKFKVKNALEKPCAESRKRAFVVFVATRPSFSLLH
jgi:hypothetical protein